LYFGVTVGLTSEAPAGYLLITIYADAYSFAGEMPDPVTKAGAKHLVCFQSELLRDSDVASLAAVCGSKGGQKSGKLLRSRYEKCQG